MSDQERISPYYIYQKTMQTSDENKEKISNNEITNWSDTKFSKLNDENRLADSKENYWWDLGFLRVN